MIFSNGVMASLQNVADEFQDLASPAPYSQRSSTATNCCYNNGHSNNNAVRASAAVRDTRFEDVYEPIADGGLCGSGSTSVVVRVRRRSDGRVFACKVCHANDGHSHHCGDDAVNFICRTSSPSLGREIRHEIEIMNKLRKLRLIQGGCSAVDDGSEIFTNNDAGLVDDPSAGIAMFVDTFVESCDGQRADDDEASSSGNETVTVYRMVSELMKGGDLRSALAERGSYAEDDARAVMKQLLRSLVFLHGDAAGITHRDIKLENILLPSELDPTKIKLADFGLSAAGTSASPSMSQPCGTPAYAAPELLPNPNNPDRKYSNKVDLWSSGVVLFMLLSGYPPFWGNKASDLLRSISEARADYNDPVWQLISEEAKDLVQKLLTKCPKKRLSARAALLHPWLAEAQEWNSHDGWNRSLLEDQK